MGESSVTSNASSGVQVKVGDDVIFDAGTGTNVLVPLNEDERATAFSLLTNALAVLAGVCITEDASDAKDKPTAHSSGGVVVQLRPPATASSSGVWMPPPREPDPDAGPPPGKDEQ